VSLGAQVMVSTYNEPLITVEWAVEVFKEARQRGLVTGFVSNGNGTERVLEFLRPHIDLYKVDLKSFNDRRYRELGGRLQPILDTIAWLSRAGVWVEIVTLLIPGFNDSDDELHGLTAFLAGVSVDIPWHVTAFHPDYRMTDVGATTSATLTRAARIGREAGLRYVYAGNLPGRVGDLEHTFCQNCGETLIARHGYLIQKYALDRGGNCPTCGTHLPGRWNPAFAGQRTSTPFLPHDRSRLSVI
jgi:pyruvate formate lyase activating enzyme